jgi:glycosyltransferase involved in cell wall biosynthesis
MLKINKLLLIGGTNRSTHLRNFHNLIADQFETILVVSNQHVDFSSCEVINFSLRNPIQFWRNVRALKLIIEAFEPDIIHVHQANSFGFMTALANQKKNIPLVLTTWGSDVLLLPNKSFLHRWMVKYVLNRADQITADAQFMASAIHQLVGPKTVLIANFGVDIDTSNNAIVRKKIIYSNRMHAPLYQIEKIIQESADFLKSNADWSIIIAGNGKNTIELEKLAAKNLPSDSYEFVGFLNNEQNKANYQSATIYVSIPTSDGTSISLLEAMAYGCIPIVSNLPANKEWVDSDVNGIIYNGNLSESIRQSLRLSIPQVQKLNLEHIEKRATKEVNKKAFVSLYMKIR